MTRVLVPLWLASLAIIGGCVDVGVPDGALVLCGADGGCPEPLTCEPETNLCVRSLVGEELTPPVASIEPDLIGGPFVDAAGTVTIDLTFEVPPLRAPTVEVTIDDVAVAWTVAGDGAAFTATLDTSRDLLDGHEGRHPVVVAAVDGRGLPRRFPVGFIEVDLTPPVIGNAAVQRLPDPRLTPVAFDIATATAVGPNVDVRVTFSVNEEVGEAPTARIAGSPLALLPEGEVVNPVTFKVDWSSTGVVDGTFDVVARVIDRAGNEVEEVIGTIDVDITPPDVPDVSVDGAVIFERAPWGRAEAAGPDVFTVVGSAGSVVAGDIVIITRDAAGLREIGRTRADADGFGGVGLGIAGRDDLLLATGDLRDVFVVVADSAGNYTAPTRVTQTRWIASPGGKTVGSVIDNPHTFESLPILTPQLGQSDASERGASDGLDAVDGAAVTTTGAGTFIARASDDGDALIPTGGVLVGTAVGHDPVRGLTVIFGGQRSLVPAEGPGAGQNVGCTDAVDDIFVRRGDGRFRRLALAATDRPPPMAKARFVFDSSRNALVLVGRPIVARAIRAPEMWSFNGTRFERFCTDADCVASIPEGLQDMGLAADPVRRVIVAHGGALGAETFEFDGRVWRAVCGDGCTEASAGPGGLVFDDVALRVLWFDGSSLSAWDGSTWTSLCTDDTCIASAPPPRFNTTAAWDRRRHRLVTFGGDVPDPPLACNFGSQTFPRNGVPADFVATPPLADTWEFDGAVWTQRVTSQSPPSRSLHQMAWDERASAVLVVGGDDCGCNQVVRDPGFRGPIDQDAWEFDGENWRRVDVAPPPPAGFVRRAALPLAFHSMVPSTGLIAGESRGVLAFGDAAVPMVLVDDGRFYTAPRSPVGNTFLAPIAADDDGRIFTLNGGQPFANVFDGQVSQPGCDTADPACTDRPPPFVAPPPLAYGAAHDGDRLVIFGGAYQPGFDFSNPFSATAVDSTYTFDAVNGLRSPCTDGSCGIVPARRVRGRLSKTGTASEVLLFGGFPGDDGTWIFRGNAWTRQTTTTTPARRQDLVLTFDPERNAVFMTGGTDDDPIGDTRGAAAERPLPEALDLVFEWTGDWHEARVADPEGDGRPAPRYAAAAAADPQGGITLQGGIPSPVRLLGGPPGSTRLADVWTWDGGSALRPAQRFRVTTAAAGLRETEGITGAAVRWFSTNDDGSPPETFVWDGSAWVTVASTSCGAGCVTAALDASLTRRAINGSGDELIFAVRGRPNGPAPGYASVSTDYVEVSITTRSD